MEHKRKLTAKQSGFIDYYLVSLNATSAAIQAGYSAKCARQIGHRLLTNVAIRQEVDARLTKLHEANKKALIIASRAAIAALSNVLEQGSWSAKVSAANSILDRAGYRFTDNVFSDLKTNSQDNYEEVRDRILGRLSKDTNGILRQ